MKQVDEVTFDDLKIKFKEMFRKKSFKELFEEAKTMPDDWKQIGSNFPKIVNPFGKKCPKCDSRKIKQVKPTIWRKFMAASVAPWGHPPKTLNVCRDCGFSWEDR